MTYGTRQLLLHDGRTHSGISGVAILIALRIVFVSYVSCFSRLVKIQSHGGMDVVNGRVQQLCSLERRCNL